MRCRYLGPGWELAKVRGTPYNTGDGIKMALDIGAQPYGNWSGCHAVAWDLNAPPFGDLTVGESYQKHSYPFGIIVNIEGKRFVDEGADFRNYTYAKYGRNILQQPQRAAFQIFDQKTVHMLRDEYRIREVTKAEATRWKNLPDNSRSTSTSSSKPFRNTTPPYSRANTTRRSKTANAHGVSTPRNRTGRFLSMSRPISASPSLRASRSPSAVSA